MPQGKVEKQQARIMAEIKKHWAVQPFPVVIIHLKGSRQPEGYIEWWATSFNQANAIRRRAVKQDFKALMTIIRIER